MVFGGEYAEAFKDSQAFGYVLHTLQDSSPILARRICCPAGSVNMVKHELEMQVGCGAARADVGAHEREQKQGAGQVEWRVHEAAG